MSRAVAGSGLELNGLWHHRPGRLDRGGHEGHAILVKSDMVPLAFRCDSTHAPPAEGPLQQSAQFCGKSNVQCGLRCVHSCVTLWLEYDCKSGARNILLALTAVGIGARMPWV